MVNSNEKKSYNLLQLLRQLFYPVEELINSRGCSRPSGINQKYQLPVH